MVASLTVCVVMVVVTTVVVIAVVVVVVNVLLWVAAMIDMVVVVEVLVIDVLTGVEIIVVGAIVIVLEFASPESYSVDVPANVPIDLFVDMSAGVMLGFLPVIDIEVLVDVNTNDFTVAMTVLEFPVSIPLEGFSRWAEFDCRPLALLDCARVLQIWMPSYHV